jgi:N-acetylmuramoyl-L-alanine amidase
MRTRVIWLVFVVLALAVAPVAQQGGDLDEQAIRTAVEQALTATPRGPAMLTPDQAGVRLVEVTVERLSGTSHRVTIDLNQGALAYAPGGDVEPLIAHIIENTARLTSTSRDVDYRFLVGGIPLDQFLSDAPAGGTRLPRAVGVTGRVVLSAGHGWYRHDASGTWRLQRDYFWGIAEDLVNWEVTHYLRNELIASSIDVRMARNPDRQAGNGVSGHPRWQEAAKYHIRDLGAPAATWDVGVDDYAKDINSRPFYANWVDAAMLISIHNNGGGGTGTETWYDTSNGHDADSRRLAEMVNARVVAAIRDRYDPAWPDRGLRSCNGCHGETRLASRPAVIVEIAFMDTKSPDNDALHSEAFKLFVAQAIRDGIQEFIGVSSSGGDFDGQVRAELVARAARDSRFGAAVDGSYGIDMSWDPSWELRWLEFEFAGDRRARLYHATFRTDRGVRFVGFWDPDTGMWRPWEHLP